MNYLSLLKHSKSKLIEMLNTQYEDYIRLLSQVLDTDSKNTAELKMINRVRRISLENITEIKLAISVKETETKDNQFDFAIDEAIISEAVLSAREIQEFLWGELHSASAGGSYKSFNKDLFIQMFQKRIDKISEIDETHPHYEVELRKRLLQQTALGIAALKVLQTKKS